MNQLTLMCMTRGKRRLISFQCQMECVEGKLDSHRDYSIPAGLAKFGYQILKMLLFLIISICIFSI